MIYIITKSLNPIVCNVIDWLNSFNIPCVRINDYRLDFEKINFTQQIGCKENNKDFFWIYKPYPKPVSNEELNTQLLYEYHQGFFKNLINENTLGQALSVVDLNKYNTLEKAKLFNIKIPHTIITNRKKDVLSFLEKHESIITKSCHDIFDININNKLYRPYTSLLDFDKVNDLNDNFGISMFQENIEKKCDNKLPRGRAPEVLEHR